MSSPGFNAAIDDSRTDWIYARHFGLHEPPFHLTPDTRFYFPHASIQSALNTCVVALRSGEGFVKVTGEVGTGKTLLCRMLLSTLDSECITAYIPNPFLEPNALLRVVAEELGLTGLETADQHRLLRTLTDHLMQLYAGRGRPVVICLDDAHAMPPATLEALRLLSNLETQRRKLLQLVLFGQPELDRQLCRSSARQLRQRIGFSSRVASLGRQDIAPYITHRMHVAGHVGSPVFSTGALRRLHRTSGGIPRLVNILAHKCLMAAYGAGEYWIRPDHVRAAARDTDSIPRGWLRIRRLAQGSLPVWTVTLTSAAAALWGAYWR